MRIADFAYWSPLGARPAVYDASQRARSALEKLKLWGAAKKEQAKETATRALPKPKPSSAAARLAAVNSLKKSAKGDEKLGFDIVAAALQTPLRQIVENGGTDGHVVVEKVMASKGNQGYNAATGEYVDMVKAGIIDPALVSRTALQNAASVASLMLTTEALIAEIPKDEKASGGGGGHSHGPGGMDF